MRRVNWITSGIPIDGSSRLHRNGVEAFGRGSMLHLVALFSLSIAILSAVVISTDEAFNPQPMWIMNVVWPATALYFGPLALLFYFRVGRKKRDQAEGRSREQMQGKTEQAEDWIQIAVATSHCGAGCALADLVTESVLFAFAITVLGSELWASYLWDFIAAWIAGIAFQYFTIKPMRSLSPSQALAAAGKADTLSILAFQVGMYGWMAVVYFVFFRQPHLHPDQAAYWFMMQIGMICGFITSYPMNRFLLRIGWKERMG